MINFSLLLAPESVITVEAVRDAALSAVIDVLDQCGYAVDRDPIAEAVDGRGWFQEYSVQPGPAALRMLADDQRGRGIQFVLHGQRFGLTFGEAEKDRALWMRLVTLGAQLSATHMVVPRLSDPDFGQSFCGLARNSFSAY